MEWILPAACTSCFAASLLLAPKVLARMEQVRRSDRSRLRVRRGGVKKGSQPERLGGSAGAVVSLAMLMGRESGSKRSSRGGSHRRRREADVNSRCADQFVQSGLSDHVTLREVATFMRRLPVVAGVFFAIVLLPTGPPGAIAGFATGAAVGWWWPRRTLARLAEERRCACERDMPSMLDIVGMGVRAGLSFDMAFRVFAQHYPGPLAHECAEASRLWASGVLSREEALRQMAERIGSEQVGRFVDISLQAIAFGSSLAPVLDELSDEMRRQRKADAEERIAKAPVKMLVPTGVLILPAMLIVVMGPVVLELAQGLI